MKLAEEGAAVMPAARNAELLRDARVEIENKGGQAAWLSLDLRKPEAPALLVDKTIDAMPHRRLGKLTFWGSFWEAITAHCRRPAYPAEIGVSSERERPYG